MASLTELEAGTAESILSSAQSDFPPQPSPRKPLDDFVPRVRFMCSFGGQILPRPHDNQLRYVGGDTRIVAVNRCTSYSTLLSKLSKLSSITDVSVKYQLPNEDLDALISVTTDEDVENMMEEYDRLSQGAGVNPKTARLRIFLFSEGADSRTSSIGSILGGSIRREHWFLDALNGGTGSGTLERGRSEASSILSEVPDYLFFDNSDDTRGPLPNPKLKSRHIVADNLSESDPGSPAPVVSASPYCSASSAPLVPSIPDLPPVKTKAVDPVQVVETTEQVIPQQTGFSGNPVWNYVAESHYPQQTLRPMPVYYIPNNNMQVQQMPMGGQYIQRQPNMGQGQVQVHYQYAIPGDGQMYGGGMRPVINSVEGYTTGMISDGMNQQMYYGARPAGMMPGFCTSAVPVGPGPQGAASEITMGKLPQ